MAESRKVKIVFDPESLRALERFVERLEAASEDLADRLNKAAAVGTKRGQK